MIIKIIINASASTTIELLVFCEDEGYVVGIVVGIVVAMMVVVVVGTLFSNIATIGSLGI